MKNPAPGASRRGAWRTDYLHRSRGRAPWKRCNQWRNDMPDMSAAGGQEAAR